MGPPDDFWDVRSHEKHQEEALRKEVGAFDAAIAVARRVTQIRNAPGFQDFVKSVQDLRDVALRKLVSEDRFTNDGLREQRGRVQGLDDVISLLTKPQMIELLEERKRSRETELAEALRRRPKPTEVNA